MQLVPLSRAAHGHLGVDRTAVAAAAAAIHLVPLVLSEIRRVASQFPVVLAKDNQTGAFYPAALLGLAPEENLFWDGTAFDAAHVPLNLLRLPFYIGPDGAVLVDAQSPALGEGLGEPILDAQGHDHDWFRGVQAILGELAGQREPTRAFVETLVARRLLTELSLDIVFADGSKAALGGLYAVDEAALARVVAGPSAPDFAELMVLAAMVGSLDHVAALVRRRNARIDAAAMWHRAGG